MKKLFALLFLFAAPAFAQYTIPLATEAIGPLAAGAIYGATVRTNNFHVVEASASSWSQALGTNPTAGDLVVCILGNKAAVTLTSVKDGAGTPNSYTVVGPVSGGTYPYLDDLYIAYLLVAPATANATINVIWSATTAGDFGCVDEPVSSGTPVYDTSGGAISSSGFNVINTPALTIANSGEFLYSLCDFTLAFASYSSSIWTVLSPGYFGGGQAAADEYLISTSSGSTAVNYVVSGSQTTYWFCYAGAFK